MSLQPAKRVIEFVRNQFDLRDLHVYGGLMIAAIGGWHISATWTCVVLGLCLAALGVFVPQRGD